MEQSTQRGKRSLYQVVIGEIQEVGMIDDIMDCALFYVIILCGLEL